VTAAMKRNFVEKKSLQITGRASATRRRSWIELWMGLIVISLLVIGNIISRTHTAWLNGEDVPRTPPQWKFLQHRLYRALDTKTESYLAPAFDLSFNDFNDSAAPRDSLAVPAKIVSRPDYTAVVGELYEYKVKVSPPASQLRFRLGQKPTGMEIDAATGVVHWTPAANQADKHQVEIIVLSDAERGTKQTYSLFATRRPHPLGTDIRGRDLIAALILGSRWSLLPGLVAVSVAMSLGLLFGGLAGYHGGRLERVLDYIGSVFESFPSLVLLFLAAVIFHFAIYPVMIMVGLIRFPRIAKAIKGKVLTLKAQQFIEAAQELGLSDAQILWKEIIWYNSRPLLLTLISYGFAFAILVEATLSYMHLGIQIPHVSWGGLLYEGYRQLLNQEYWLFFWPALTIVAAILGFYLLADGVNRMYKIKGE
jgi:peptide/nickel transport system permease protein